VSIRRVGDLGGQLTPFAGQTRVCALDRLERAPRDRGMVRGQERAEDRVPRQGMAEAEGTGIDGDKLRIHRTVEACGDGRLFQPRNGGQQIPFKTAAEDRGRKQDRPGVVAQLREPAANAVGERERHDGLHR
jgi:hypothetical protein